MKKGKKTNTELPAELPRVNLSAAGIDIGATAHFVAVPPGRDVETVREFGAFTPDLHRLADWLNQCEVDTVVMESTGVFWIPLFELLEQRGFEVKLVDPRRLRHVPGRKTDVLDCQWLQQLHTFGLLSGAFRPSDAICVLRGYLRQRGMLVRSAAEHIQHMQKALTQMNVKLQHVVSDVTGVTGMNIIRAIVAGERNPEELASFRDPHCKNDAVTIAKALQGNWREEHLFTLQQALELYDVYQAKISDCDKRIEDWLQSFPHRVDGAPPPTRKRKRNTRGNAPRFDAHESLYRMAGVDLTTIDGIDDHSALKLVGEVGVDMNPWPSVKHFTSWLGLCPGSKVSGGKVLSSRTKPCASRAADTFRMAASSLHRFLSPRSLLPSPEGAQRNSPRRHRYCPQARPSLLFLAQVRPCLRRPGPRTL